MATTSAPVRPRTPAVPITAPGGRGRAGAVPAALAAAVREPRRALVVALAVLSIVPCLDVAGDPDLWWHIRTGRWILDNLTVPRQEMFTYTAAGNPWTAHEWGSEVLFAALNAVGGVLLIGVVMAAVTWSGLWALALRARDRGAGWGLCTAAMLLGARAMQPVTGSRPQMFTFALCCWTLLLAERHLSRGGRRIWLLPPIVMVWANLHAGFLFGVGLIAAVATIEAARTAAHRPTGYPWRRVAELGAAVVVSLAAACVNPSGPGLLGYAVSLTHEVSGLPIVEWMRPDLLSWGLVAADLLVLGIPLLLLLRGRLGLRDALLVAGGTVAALIAARNLAVLVAVALPAWAWLVQQVVERVRADAAAARRLRPRASAVSVATRRPSRAVAFAVLGVGMLGVGAVGARAVQAASSAGLAQVQPACAVAVLGRSAASLRVFAPYATSGYLIGALWPRVTVYDYGELLAPGPQVLADDIRIAAGVAETPSALSLLDASATDAVLIAPGALTAQLAAVGGWTRVTRDPVGMELWLRGDPGWARGPGC